MGGTQSARAALGQTCCYATEHFDIQEQRLSKVKYACHLEKKEKAEWSQEEVFVNFALLNYGVTVALIANIY